VFVLQKAQTYPPNLKIERETGRKEIFILKGEALFTEKIDKYT
jgi:hypothetical protein